MKSLQNCCRQFLLTTVNQKILELDEVITQAPFEFSNQHKICFNMSKQNQIKDFSQNSRKMKRVVIMNMGNSIALDLYRFLIQENLYIRAKVLRNISLKFHNSFQVKLFAYRFFERTLSMAEATLLQV